MNPPSLFFPFILALLSALFSPLFLPHVHLIAFAPFLAIAYSRKSFLPCLWLSFCCGLIIDLLSSQLRFGLYALNYSLTAVLIHSQRRHFFEEKPLALALFTALISCTSTLLELLLLYTFDKKLSFTWKLAVTDLIGMPLLDAVYAFLWFTCPMKLAHHIRRVGWAGLFLKKN